ncbi:hypothetical protein AAFM48_16925 [Burkholderia pseudomallei]
MSRNDAHQGGSAIDGRTSRHAGYGISQVIRKRIEEHFGWGKTVGRIRQTVYRGIGGRDLQTDDAGEQPDSNISNTDGGATGGNAVSRLSMAVARQRAGWTARQRGSRDDLSATQQPIAYETLLNSAPAVKTRRFPAAC